MLRSLPWFLLLSLMAGCANPWTRGYEKNPLLARRDIRHVAQTRVQLMQFEKLQTFARTEIEQRAAISAATQPSTLPSLPGTPDDRLKKALSMTGQSVSIIGWSQFDNWELLNSDEKRLAAFAKHLGANQVILASEYFFKTKYDINRPMTTYLDLVSPRPAHPGFFAPKRLPELWWQANGKADRYFYTVIFLRNDSLPR